MPNFLKHEVVAKILDIGLLPTFYNGNTEIAKKSLRHVLEEELRS